MEEKVMNNESIAFLDFFITVLREHEKELSNLITDLGETVEQSSRTQRILHRSPVIGICKHWENFKFLARNAKIVSFQAEEAFQVSALNKGLILKYSGELQKEFSENLKQFKTWLSRELNVVEEKIFEGILAIK